MSKIIQKVQELQSYVTLLRPLKPNENTTVQERLRVEWTYNSNAIEGNTLNFGETLFFLREGLTSEGKPFKDYLEAKNHSEAIEGLEEILRSERPLTESTIKELHAVLMKGMEYTIAKGGQGQAVRKPLQTGKYKMHPNHVLTLSGKIHHYTDPIHVQEEMEKLVTWYRQNKKLDPIEKAAVFHYRFVAIHPFDGGNGRMARLLMNLILMQAGYPPCIIKNIHRKAYLKALATVDHTKNFEPFVDFVATELLETLETMLSVLEGRDEVPLELYFLNHLEREQLILDALARGPLSIGQIHLQTLQIPRPTLKSDLKILMEKGKVKREGRGKGVVYSLNLKPKVNTSTQGFMRRKSSALKH